MPISQFPSYSRKQYTAAVIAISQHTGWQGVRRMICLGDVYLNTGEKVRDHAWVPAEEFGVHLDYGDVITFTAELEPYFKGSRHRTTRRGKEAYQFRRIKDLTFVEREERAQ